MSAWNNAVRITAPPQEVWKVLADLPHSSQWQPNVKWAIVESKGPFGPGTQVKLETAQGTVRLSVKECAAPERLVMEVDRVGVKGRSTYVLTPMGDETVVEHRLDLELAGLASLFSFTVGGSLKKELLSLKKWVERTA